MADNTQKSWSLTGFGPSGTRCPGRRSSAICALRRWSEMARDRPRARPGIEDRGRGKPRSCPGDALQQHGLRAAVPDTWTAGQHDGPDEEARYLSQADLYVITPQMLAVVAAAAQTLQLQRPEPAARRRPARPDWFAGPAAAAARCGCLPGPSRKPAPIPGGCPGAFRCLPARASPDRAARRPDVVLRLRSSHQRRLPAGGAQARRRPASVRAGLHLVAAASPGHGGATARPAAARGRAAQAQPRVLGRGEQVPVRGW